MDEPIVVRVQVSPLTARQRQRADLLFEKWLRKRDVDTMIDSSIVREWVESYGLQQHVAELADVSTRTIGDIMSGRRSRMKLSAASRIAKATDRWVDYLEVERSALRDAEDPQNERGSSNTRRYEFRTGQDGWSSVSRHCLECGTFYHPHHARGLCYECHYARALTIETGRLHISQRAEQTNVEAAPRRSA